MEEINAARQELSAALGAAQHERARLVALLSAKDEEAQESGIGAQRLEAQLEQLTDSHRQIERRLEGFGSANQRLVADARAQREAAQHSATSIERLQRSLAAMEEEIHGLRARLGATEAERAQAQNSLTEVRRPEGGTTHCFPPKH